MLAVKWHSLRHGVMLGQRHRSGDALGRRDLCQARHLCLNIIAKANKGSWSLLVEREVY